MRHGSNFKLYHGPRIDGPLGVLLMIGWQEDAERKTTTFDTYLLVPTRPSKLVCDHPARTTYQWVNKDSRLGGVDDALKIEELCRYYENTDSVTRSHFHSIEQDTCCEAFRDCLTRLREGVTSH